MEEFVLKYDKNIAMKTGALSYKLYVFMLSIAALIVFISSAVFELICYVKGFSIPVMNRYTAKIAYVSMFLLFIWFFSTPIWYPAHIAENLVFVKKNNKLYKIKNKKDNIFDREKYLENNDFLNTLIEKLPKKNANVFIEEFEDVRVLRKTKKYAILEVKDEEDKTKKIKIYNIYDNFDKLGNENK